MQVMRKIEKKFRSILNKLKINISKKFEDYS